MTEIKGDIWDFHARSYPIVIPTNGDVNSAGECVMGRGVALQAKNQFPKLAKELGDRICGGGSRVRLFPEYRLLAFPVKFHWRESADLGLIDRSAEELVAVISRVTMRFPIYLPRVGCGNGRLRWRDVRPVLAKYLDDRFVVIELEAE